MQGIYILSGVRTPIGKFGGTLASLTAADMGVVAAKAAMERAGIEPAQVDETIIGCARQAGGGPNVARQISVRSGVREGDLAVAFHGSTFDSSTPRHFDLVLCFHRHSRIARSISCALEAKLKAMAVRSDGRRGTGIVEPGPWVTAKKPYPKARLSH